MNKSYNLVSVYSHSDFDALMQKMDVNDGNVEQKFNNLAFISIVGTDECQKYYLEEEEKHWFSSNHKNVLNLEFDDISEDIVYKGHLFRTINETQCDNIIDFITNNLEKDFIIHCRAGKSRSQAIFRFMADCFPLYFHIDESALKNNPCLTPNFGVLSKLKHKFVEKIGFN